MQVCRRELGTALQLTSQRRRLMETHVVGVLGTGWRDWEMEREGQHFSQHRSLESSAGGRRSNDDSPILLSPQLSHALPKLIDSSTALQDEHTVSHILCHLPAPLFAFILSCSLVQLNASLVQLLPVHPIRYDDVQAGCNQPLADGSEEERPVGRVQDEESTFYWLHWRAVAGGMRSMVCWY
jgi:hypothetical protein